MVGSCRTLFLLDQDMGRCIQPLQGFLRKSATYADCNCTRLVVRTLELGYLGSLFVHAIARLQAQFGTGHHLRRNLRRVPVSHRIGLIRFVRSRLCDLREITIQRPRASGHAVIAATSHAYRVVDNATKSYFVL